MKIRQDFVTNSSSNSFIVAWEKAPENVRELMDVLKCDKELAEFLLKRGTKADFEILSAYMRDLVYVDIANFVWDLKDSDKDQYFRLSNILSSYHSQEHAKKFLDGIDIENVRVYTFADSGCDLEIDCHDHSPFGNQKQIKINGH